MIADLLKSLFETPTVESHPSHELAAVALLMEVAMADGQFDEQERQSLCRAAARTFQMKPEEIDSLIARAQSAQADAVSHFEFTRVINAEFSAEQKFELVVAMWQLAYADGDLDRYEEHTIRKLAELVHVSHSDFIRAKLHARDL